LPVEVSTLSEYLELLRGFEAAGADPLWYRGHGDYRWRLCPRVLRYRRCATRERAIALLSQFKQMAPRRLPHPLPSGDLEWMQTAQHYGLPTRLLDWTMSRSVALYFACLHPDVDGVVSLLDPLALNAASLAGQRVILDGKSEPETVAPYLYLGAPQDELGVRTVAIAPPQSNERIACQKGTFTLHGSHRLALTLEEAPTLIAVPILRRHKRCLMRELRDTDTDRAALFPEPEHLCKHLCETTPGIGRT
jgi:hypothetical protein